MSQNDDANTRETVADGASPQPTRPTGTASRSRPVPPGPDRVGYGKPPKEHQFRPGQSGNPKGRPKGAKNKPPATAYEQRLDALLLEEFYREVGVPVGGEMQTVTKAGLGMRALMARAIKGSVPAIRLSTEMARRVEARQVREQEEAFRAMAQWKIDGTREVERRRQLGLKIQPEIIPHPDHIFLEFHIGTVRMEGPLTREQKAAVEQVLATLQAREAEIAGYAESLEVFIDPKIRRELEAVLQGMRDEVEELRAQLLDWASRSD